MSEPTVVTVTCCDCCPYLNSRPNGWECGAVEPEARFPDGQLPATPPDWCPLRAGILIRLAGPAHDPTGES